MKPTLADPGHPSSRHSSRYRNPQARSAGARMFALLLIIVVFVVAARIGSRQIYLGLDSIGHYVSVWFVHLSFANDSVPVSNPFLQSGDARALPYGLVPYVVSSLFYDDYGDQAVSILMAIVAIAMIALVGFTKLRRDPILAACFAISLPFVDGLLSFQFVFFWAALFFFLYDWALERNWRLLAGLFMWATIVTHPIIGLQAVAIHVVLFVRRHRDSRGAVLRMCVAAAALAAPVLIYSLGDPSFSEAPKLPLLGKFIWRSAFGLSILFGPFILLRFRRVILRHHRRAQVALVASTALWLLADQSSWVGLIEDTNPSTYESYFHSGYFRPGAIYRVMEPEDKEDGQYYFVQRGAILANSFFTETMFRQSWDSYREYQAFLAEQRIDYVVLDSEYLDDFNTNELNILLQLEERGECRVLFVDPVSRFIVFDVRSPLDMADAGSPGSLQHETLPGH